MERHESASEWGAFIRSSTKYFEVVSVYGDVDISNVDDFRDAIVSAGSAGKPVVVDLTRSLFIGAAALNVVAAENAASASSVTVVASPRIEKLLELVGLTDLLKEPGVVSRGGDRPCDGCKRTASAMIHLNGWRLCIDCVTRGTAPADLAR